MKGVHSYRNGYNFIIIELPCIYIIRCVINRAVYIGQTGNDLTREAQHFTELRAGTHVNYKLQADYNKFGDDSFYFRRVKSPMYNKRKRIWLESDYIIRAKNAELYNNGVKIYNILIPKRETIGFKFNE